MKYNIKTLFRSIKSSFGRYLSILLIVALGIGFFTGLRNAEPAMEKTLDKYYEDLNMYDFNLISTLGFTKDDIDELSTVKYVLDVEGSYKLDVVGNFNNSELVLELMSVTDKISLPNIIKGRMPENSSECLADDVYFSESDIGSVITFKNNDNIKITNCTISGLAKSPRYINIERGDSTLKEGKKNAFLYLDKSVFEGDVFTEVLVTLDKSVAVSHHKYDSLVKKAHKGLEEKTDEITNRRYEEVVSPIASEIRKGEQSLKLGKDAYENAINSGVPSSLLEDNKNKLIKSENELKEARAKLNKITKESYVLDLDSNLGYVRFNNDISIVSAIASAFPVFFLLIASLICFTTMSRMVKEDRTNIGVMKALGLSTGAIASKFVLYGASAAFIGCMIGFLLGTSVIPIIIWTVYDMWYGFTELEFYFSTAMYFTCIIITILISFLITYFTCKKELNDNPANLMRPLSPGKGKRIFFEYITFFWKRLSFLSKVVMRNTFRYKKRLVMMFLGIGGCTALMVTGFGLKDSVANILNYQYDEIMLYDAYASVDKTPELTKILEENSVHYLYGHEEEVIIASNDESIETTLIAVDNNSYQDFINLHQGKEKINYPGKSEVVITKKIQDKLKLKENDQIKIKGKTYTIKGIADNYFNSYIYVSKDDTFVDNYLFINMDNEKKLDKLASKLKTQEDVKMLTLVSSDKEMMEDSMFSLNYVIILIVFCSGALALIVLYNLTNISVLERSREIATVKVLGFNYRETGAYILRENIILAVIGSGVGLLLGKLLHAYVISQIDVDYITVDIRISWLSYLLAFILSLAFTFLCNLIMRFKLERINMAESLKSYE